MSLSPRRLEQLLELAYEAQDEGRLPEFLATLEPAEREALQLLLESDWDAAAPEAHIPTAGAAQDTAPDDSSTSNAAERPPHYRPAPDPLIGVQVGEYCINRFAVREQANPLPDVERISLTAPARLGHREEVGTLIFTDRH